MDNPDLLANAYRNPKQHNVPNQYWKCSVTGIEVNFTFTRGTGWGASFPRGFKGMRTLKDQGIKVPFPEVPPEYDYECSEWHRRFKEYLNNQPIGGN